MLIQSHTCVLKALIVYIGSGGKQNVSFNRSNILEHYFWETGRHYFFVVVVVLTVPGGNHLTSIVIDKEGTKNMKQKQNVALIAI